jgi:hypothetical protein
MSKTLAESAAEILKASMNAGKEPAATPPPTEVEDLGGATNDNPAGNAFGSVAAAKKKEAQKPGAPGVPAEGTKKMAAEATEESEEDVLSEEEEIELTEEELDEYLDSLTEEELEALAEEEELNEISKDKIGQALAKADDEKNAAYDAGDQKAGYAYHTQAMRIKAAANRAGKGNLSLVKQRKMANMEEEVDEAAERASYKAGIVAKYRGSMKEDVDALFNGESLSEDFRVKATLIFEAAVQSRVEAILEEVLDENDAVLEEAIANVQEELSEQVDDYLNYVVEEWVEENQVAIETGLRAELVEDFIGGLKNLFAEHYIDIPDTKVDIAEALAAQVAELQEEASETEEVLASLVEELSSVKKTEAIARICEGLTQVQAEKMKSLAEGVEFTAEGDFDNKLAVIRENYFPSKVSVKSEVKTLQESYVEEPEVAEVPSYMRQYVNAITKTAPKA